MTPLFKWAGSKRYLADALIPKFPADFRRYVEPFCGSASLYFLVEPDRALLGDLNADLVNALTCVRNDPCRVAQGVASLPTDEEDYYLVRSLHTRELTKYERAARFLYLNRYCFNGLYRTNKSGEFNVPYGSKPRLPYDDKALYRQASSLLRKATLLARDFEQICELVRPGDFVYLDPPYATTTRRTFTEYGQQAFCVEDLCRLASALQHLDSINVPFMLSYADGPEIRAIAAAWRVDKLQVRRNIAGFVGHRRTAREVVIRNY